MADDLDIDVTMDLQSLLDLIFQDPRSRQMIVDMVRKDMLKNARYYGNIFATYAQQKR
jgi:hypothetical protein